MIAITLLFLVTTSVLLGHYVTKQGDQDIPILINAVTVVITVAAIVMQVT